MSYFATKYDSPAAETLYNVIMFDWDTDWSGESDYGLWFSVPVTIEKLDVTHSDSALVNYLATIEGLTITEQFQALQSLTGHYLAVSDDRGFCSVWSFPSKDAAEIEYDRLERLYSQWADQDSDDDSDSAGFNAAEWLSS